MKRERKNRRRRIKYIMNDISYLMGFVFFASIAALDSEKMWIPMTGLFISGAWLFVHAWVRDFLCNRRAGKHYAVSNR